jgi:hypothetical protein
VAVANCVRGSGRTIPRSWKAEWRVRLSGAFANATTNKQAHTQLPPVIFYSESEIGKLRSLSGRPSLKLPWLPVNRTAPDLVFRDAVYQSDVQMMEQSREPFLLSFPCCFPHIVQSLEHAIPALCRVLVRWNDVLLRLCPFLPNFRRRLSFLVRLVHRFEAGPVWMSGLLCLR